MAVSVQFFGAASFLITTSTGKRVMIDPFLDSHVYSPVKVKDLDTVDLLLITHNAHDHFGDAPSIISRFGCPVICAKDVMHNLIQYHGVDPDLFRVTIWGLLLEECGVRVRSIESHHWSFNVGAEGNLLSGPATGFIVEADPGVRIYHPGDSALSYDMKLRGGVVQTECWPHACNNSGGRRDLLATHGMLQDRRTDASRGAFGNPVAWAGARYSQPFC